MVLFWEMGRWNPAIKGLLKDIDEKPNIENLNEVERHSWDLRKNLTMKTRKKL